MHNFYIRPHLGVDDIEFDRNRDVIRTIIGIEAEEYDNFDFYTFMTVYYNDEDLCEAIMLQNFSDIEHYSAILENIDIFQLSYLELKNLLADLDDDIEIGDEEIISTKLGIKVKARPNDDFENDTCEYIYLYK